MRLDLAHLLGPQVLQSQGDQEERSIGRLRNWVLENGSCVAGYRRELVGGDIGLGLDSSLVLLGDIVEVGQTEGGSLAEEAGSPLVHHKALAVVEGYCS